MTRQWGRAYDWVVRFLTQRDGDKCYLCGLKTCKNHGHSLLVVEHRDNDETNYEDLNLGLAHRCCNTLKNPRGSLPPNALPKGECVSVGGGRAHAIEPKMSDGYAAIKNAEGEPAFRIWVFRYLLAHREDPPTPRFLTKNGAALTGESPVTIGRYLDKMTAELFGCLDDTMRNAAGQQVVMLVSAEDYLLTAEQLDEKYPWAGQRYRPKGDAEPKEEQSPEPRVDKE